MAVRVGQWQFVAKHTKSWELRDINEDRIEMIELAEKQPERVKEMAAKWDA